MFVGAGTTSKTTTCIVVIPRFLGVALAVITTQKIERILISNQKKGLTGFPEFDTMVLLNEN